MEENERYVADGKDENKNVSNNTLDNVNLLSNVLDNELKITDDNTY